MRTAVRALSALLIVGILATMLRPAVPMPGGQWDKAAHAAAFLLIGLALHPGLKIGLDRRGRLAAALLAVALGAVVEAIQPYVGRGRDALDLAADAVGAAVAWTIAPMVLRRLMSWLARGSQA